MFSFLFGFFLGSRGYRVPRALRIALGLFLAGLLLVVTVYTVHVILTLPERTSGHVHHAY